MKAEREEGNEFVCVCMCMWVFTVWQRCERAIDWW